MALGVDLFRLNADGAVIWHRMCRGWKGRDLQDILATHLKPADPDPSWECTLTSDEAREFADRFEPADFRSRFSDDPDLTELLHTSETERVRLQIEEWGYG